VDAVIASTAFFGRPPVLFQGRQRGLGRWLR
jgi:hypothetical protein